MKKQEFIAFVSEQQDRGCVRFSLGFSENGEIILYWTNNDGYRLWCVLNRNRGKKPSQINRERMLNYRRWLHTVRKST